MGNEERQRTWRARAVRFFAGGLLAAGAGTGVLTLTHMAAASAAPTCTLNWTAAGDGNWGTGTNWTVAGGSTHRIPKSTDYVCIPAARTVTVDVSTASVVG